MKRSLIFIFLIWIAAGSCFAGGKEETYTPKKVAVKFIVFDRKTSSGNRAYEKLRPIANRLKAGYLDGYRFEYGKDGLVRTTVDTAVSGESDKKLEQKMITVNKNEYVYLAGKFEYTTPAFPQKAIQTGMVSVSGSDSIHALYGRLLGAAVRNNCKAGSKGIIYPIGDLDYSISADKVKLKGKFLIYRK